MLSPEEKFGFEKGENINCVSYCKVKGEPCRVPERERQPQASLRGLQNTADGDSEMVDGL